MVETVRDVVASVEARRKRLGMNQSELARAAGISRQTLYILEKETKTPGIKVSSSARTLRAVDRVLKERESNLKIDDREKHEADAWNGCAKYIRQIDGLVAGGMSPAAGLIALSQITETYASKVRDDTDDEAVTQAMGYLQAVLQNAAENRAKRN